MTRKGDGSFIWMALHKLNVLHWHLTDDQAWRLEIKKYPRLTSVGAWRVPAGAAPASDIDPTTGRPRLYGGFYSQDTVRKIVAHASERNITIVPEIDLPGHATAAVVAYPRLASVVPRRDVPRASRRFGGCPRRGEGICPGEANPQDREA